MQTQLPNGRDENPKGSEIDIPSLIAFLIFVAFGAFILHAGLWAWMNGWQTKADRSAHGITGTERTHFPMLQIKPQGDLETYRQQQEWLLTNYTWMNRTEGVVRIPIGAAIDRILRSGIPRWGPTNQTISQLEYQQARARREGER